jgi:hypothetical protein
MAFRLQKMFADFNNFHFIHVNTFFSEKESVGVTRLKVVSHTHTHTHTQRFKTPDLETV